MRPLYLPALFVFLCLFQSCKKDKNKPVDNSIAVLSFIFSASDNPTALKSDVKADVHGDSVLVAFPAGTDLHHLTPEISYQGKSISPVSGIPQDFSVPVLYTITAPNGITAR